MSRILYVNCARCECRYVALELDSTHELGEPWPQAKAVEMPEQRGVMKPDPAAAPLFDVALEGRYCCRCPVIRRIVQLDEELVAGEESIGDRTSIRDVVDCEVVANRLFAEPYSRSVDEWFMNSALLRKRNHMELRCLRLRPQSARTPEKQGRDASDPEPRYDGPHQRF